MWTLESQAQGCVQGQTHSQIQCLDVSPSDDQSQEDIVQQIVDRMKKRSNVNLSLKLHFVSKVCLIRQLHYYSVWKCNCQTVKVRKTLFGGLLTG